MVQIRSRDPVTVYDVLDDGGRPIVQLGYTAGAVRMQAMGGEAAKAAAQVPTSPPNVEFYAPHKAEIEPLEADLRTSGKGDDD